jgi:hypothetical protein|tara:strand:+ start:5495 stop:5881 length:387 start_codon:yes stop_codon:yes gene_type:complete
MADLFQPSPLFLFVIFFKTTVYLPLCASLGLLMSIFSNGRARLGSIVATVICLIILIATNPILIQIESLAFLSFAESFSNLAYGWFFPFFVSFLFSVRTILYRFSNLFLETLHFILLGLALFFLFLTL